MKRAATLAVLALIASLPLAVACGTPISSSQATPPPPVRVAPVASASGLPPELKGPEYTENDFVESDRNRDPFRSFLVEQQPANDVMHEEGGMTDAANDGGN